MGITCLQPDLGSVIPIFTTNYGTTGDNPGVFGAVSEMAPLSCNSCVLFGIIFTGSPGVDPGDVTVNPVSNNGDVFTHLSTVTNLGSGSDGSMRISYWYCLSTKVGANRISFTSNAAVTAGIAFVELQSNVGGLFLDASQSFNVSANTTASLSLPGPGNGLGGSDFYFAVLGTSQNNGAANNPPWTGGTFPPPAGFPHGGAATIGSNTGTKNLTVTVGSSQNLLALAASFKEDVVTFPTLSATPSSLTFVGNPGGSSPSPQTVSLTASPTNTTYAATGYPSWVGVSPSSGTTPDTITVTPTLSSALFLANGGFETGKMSPWNIGSPAGTPLPAITTAQAHSGTFSCVLGAQTTSGINGISEIYQDIIVTPDFTIDFWYLPKSDFNSCDDHQQCLLYDLSGNLLDTLLDTWDDEPSFQHVTRDETFLVGDSIVTLGQTIRLVFRVINDSTCGDTDGPFVGFTYMYVDDVTVSGVEVVLTSDCTTHGAPKSLFLSFTPSGTAPEITGVSERCGDPGDHVILTGTSFGASQGGSTVTVDGITAAVTSWADTSVTITIPAGVNSPGGTVIIQMTVGGIVSNGVEWDSPCGSPTPTIIGLSAGCGNIGQGITITGFNFGATQDTSTVTVNGVSASVIGWSATSIAVVIPSTTTGNIVVTVGGISSTGTLFTIPCPSLPIVTGVSPSCGGFSTQVTITGSNFKSTQGLGSVAFAGVTATNIISWSDTQIVCTVPVILAASILSTNTVFNDDGTSAAFDFAVCLPNAIRAFCTGIAGGFRNGNIVEPWQTTVGIYAGFPMMYWQYFQDHCPSLGGSGFDRIVCNADGFYYIGANFKGLSGFNGTDTVTSAFDFLLNGVVIGSGSTGNDFVTSMNLHAGDYIQFRSMCTDTGNHFGFIASAAMFMVESTNVVPNIGTIPDATGTGGSIFMVPASAGGVCSVPSPDGDGVVIPDDGSIYLIQGKINCPGFTGSPSSVALFGIEETSAGGAATFLSESILIGTPTVGANTLNFATIFRGQSTPTFTPTLLFATANTGAGSTSTVSGITLTRLYGTSDCCTSPPPSPSPGSSSTGPCVATLGIFSYQGKTPSINEGFFLSGFTGSLAFLNGQTVFVLSVDPSAMTFTAEVSGGGAVLPPVPQPSPSVSPGPAPAPDDMLDWITISYPLRTTHHLTGLGNNSYNWKDADGQKIWLIKNGLGNPWDIYVYDENFIHHWVTENADQGTWAVATAYKEFHVPVPVIKRFFDTSGPAFVVDTPGPNASTRTINCGVDNQPFLHLGDVRGITNPPTIMTWPGLGTFPTIRVDWFYGGTFATSFHQKEQFFYVKGLGLIQWTHATLVSGNYQIDQTTTKDAIALGGCPTPNFPCYPFPGWIGGVPGAGGNVP